jgi:hypothetical protein
MHHVRKSLSLIVSPVPRSDAANDNVVRQNVVPFRPRPQARSPEVAHQMHELVVAASRGNRKAIGAIAVAFSPNLLDLARHELKDPQDAEDVLQDLFVFLMEGLAKDVAPLPGEGLGYLERILREFIRAENGVRPKEDEGG